MNHSGYAGGTFLMASEGGQILSPVLLPDTGPATAATIPGQGDVMLGPLMTADFRLPPDAASAIVLTRIAYGSRGLPSPPTTGLVIDDLRVE